MDKTIFHQSLTVYYRMEGIGQEGLSVREDPMSQGRLPGPPVLLLHGFAEDNSIWDGQVEYLKKNYRVIIPDLPGSGRSSLLRGETSMENLADFVAAILDGENIRQCVLIGHSMGGYIALAFAEKYPDRLKALGLFHSTAYADSEEKKIARRKGIEFIRKNGSSSFIRQSIPNLFAERSRKEQPGIIAGLIDRYINFNPDSLIYYYNAMIRRPDRTEILKKFTKPILFIIGSQDNAVPLEDSLQQSHMPGLSYIHILENTGHLGMLEDREGSNLILDEFLGQIRAIS